MLLMVLDVTGASPKLRGALSRRYIEIRAGLFVGSATSRMLDEAWELVVDENPTGAILAHAARNEMGVAFRQYGENSTLFSDCDGLQLAMRRKIFE